MRYIVPRPPCMEYPPRNMRESGKSEYPYYGGQYPAYPPYPNNTYPKAPYAKPYPNYPYVSPDYFAPAYSNPPYMNPAYPNNPYPYPPAQNPNNEMPGSSMPGYNMPNMPPNMPGEQMPGQEMPGNKMPGEQMPGQEMPGNKMPGEQMPGQEMPGNKMPGEQMPEHEMPDNKMRDQVMPGYDYNPKYCPQGMEPYTVRMGDTLYLIAKMYGVGVDDIMATNPQIVDPNVIYAGQLLCIPQKRPCVGFLYTIKPGDTLYNIAMSFGMSLEGLLQANPNINPESYRDGETICIPEINPCPGNTMVYMVKKDDTLTSILAGANVSLNALMAANPTFDPYNIVPQTRLCIIPTPCEPVCPKEKRMTIPDKIKDIKQLADYLKTTTDSILLANPNYPPCHFMAGCSICKP